MRFEASGLLDLVIVGGRGGDILLGGHDLVARPQILLHLPVLNEQMVNAMLGTTVMHVTEDEQVGRAVHPGHERRHVVDRWEVGMDLHRVTGVCQAPLDGEVVRLHRFGPDQIDGGILQGIYRHATDVAPRLLLVDEKLVRGFVFGRLGSWRMGRRQLQIRD